MVPFARFILPRVLACVAGSFGHAGAESRHGGAGARSPKNNDAFGNLDFASGNWLAEVTTGFDC